LTDAAGDDSRQARIGGEGGLHVRREFGPDILGPQNGDPRDVSPSPECQAGGGVDRPDAVMRSCQNGRSGRFRPPRRPELAEQSYEVRLGLADGDIRLPALPSAECVGDYCDAKSGA
jgi:hypothetical protein